MTGARAAASRRMAPAPARDRPRAASGAMTAAQRDVVLLLAEVYLRVGRPRRAAMLAALAQARDPGDVGAMRALLRAHLALGDADRAMAQVDALVEHEFDSAELAFTLSAQAQALAVRGDGAGARAVWAEYLALCRASGLSATEAMA